VSSRPAQSDPRRIISVDALKDGGSRTDSLFPCWRCSCNLLIEGWLAQQVLKNIQMKKTKLGIPLSRHSGERRNPVSGYSPSATTLDAGFHRMTDLFDVCPIELLKLEKCSVLNFALRITDPMNRRQFIRLISQGRLAPD